jgi:hypothetical protein
MKHYKTRPHPQELQLVHSEEAQSNFLLLLNAAHPLQHDKNFIARGDTSAAPDEHADSEYPVHISFRCPAMPRASVQHTASETQPVTHQVSGP